MDGAWWPRSRDLSAECADLVDHFPAQHGRITRLLFSRPDWDTGEPDGTYPRRIPIARGQIKCGSFPADDTHLIIAITLGGGRWDLMVIPHDTAPETATALMAFTDVPDTRTASELLAATHA